ncbi:MAG: DUF3427 domain-containing protein, partial [Leptospira sp.]|nr:DUF3427 domain-containing protein [Leptospira sp.]
KNSTQYEIHLERLDPADSSVFISKFLAKLLHRILDSLGNSEDRVRLQIELANSFILWLSDYLETNPNLLDSSEYLLKVEGELLKAIYSRENRYFSNLADHLKSITPVTGLSQSELFTGSNQGLTMESELKKEIQSCDEICWLVSFVKWTGVRIIIDSLKQFTFQPNKRFRIITTTYLGATDQKALDELAKLPNTEIKINYESLRERLHAKAYLFLRNTGYHTGYIGSSNLSRSALSSGLEWNLKITSQEIPHIISKFRSSFESYWNSKEFETYDFKNEGQRAKLQRSLEVAKYGSSNPNNMDDKTTNLPLFDLEPHPHQQEILESLKVERDIHKRKRNLIVAATGTGKTMIAGFDFRNFLKTTPGAKFLFIAHREEILTQSLYTFRGILKDPNFGELWFNGKNPSYYHQLFASIQTLNNRIDDLTLAENYYDYIVIDEVHHIAANSYRKILEKFKPRILLGLTATPERHDGSNILVDFDGTIAAELRLPEAINRKYLCPFQYFGVADNTDISGVSWRNGRYDINELSNLYTNNDARVLNIFQNLDYIISDWNSIKGLGFCVSQDHAEFMARKFNERGIASAFLTSRNSEDRKKLRDDLLRGRIRLLFVVDIFNEGVDIPEINTVLFLRPTESLTIFLQQLGRGLRNAPDKECLTVIDFVGNSRPEYDFTRKFQSLVTSTHRSISHEIEEDFPHLPLGCSIVLQKQVKEVILNNIKKAIVDKNYLVQKIATFETNTGKALTLKNFLNYYSNISLDSVYKVSIDKSGGWTKLCQAAKNLPPTADAEIEKAYYRIFLRILSSESHSYFSFLYKMAKNEFHWNVSDPEECQMAIMVYMDFWNEIGTKCKHESIEHSFEKLKLFADRKDELIQLLEIRIDSLRHEEFSMDSNAYPSLTNCPLRMHARYARDQILTAFGQHSFEKKSSSREGVLDMQDINTELLFVTLQKTEKNYSPTTMYNDYAITERLFHWQTQNTARPDKGKGLSYIEQSQNQKTILLFVREKNRDEYGKTMGYVNLGPVHYFSHEGSQPMSITWKLDHSIPPFLWRDTAKLAIA